MARVKIILNLPHTKTSESRDYGVESWEDLRSKFTLDFLFRINTVEMVLKTFDVSAIKQINAEPLTPEGFAPFGGVISADHQIKEATTSAANYGTAVKIHKVAPVIDKYAECPSGEKASANWNIFRCKAPKHLIRGISSTEKVYTSKILERHPFSTQTFVPMGQDRNILSFLVIVAKSDPNTAQELPDPSSLCAFYCKGNQSITYGKGVWHAPMVVIDENVNHIDYAVFIHENGVAEEDCQECYFEPGFEIKYTFSESPNSSL